MQRKLTQILKAKSLIFCSFIVLPMYCKWKIFYESYRVQNVIQ